MLNQREVDRLQAKIAELTGPDYNSYKPLVLKAGNPHDQRHLEQIVGDFNPVFHDQLKGQVKELLKIRHPEKKLSDEDLDDLFVEWAEKNDINSFGNYVYYPWSNKLIRLLGEEDFIELRTSRNKYKITAEEQARLRDKTVGVVGLSVGQSVALTIATERIAGKLRLADFDILELSNLNRIRTGLHNIGQSKVVTVAREISEIDPYIELELFQEGLTAENMDAFLGGPSGQIDLLMEECDSLPIKIQVRENARQKGIPVLMDTSDRGMIDIERFDLEPERPLLHGKAVESVKELADLAPDQHMKLLMSMVDFQNTSERLRYSYSEIGKSLTTWPQLASDVIAGGGFAAKIARHILLGEELKSGRYYIELPDELYSQKN